MSALAALAPEAVEQVSRLHGEFTSAEPFRHVVCDQFLQPDLCRRLAAEFPPFDEAMARNELGEIGGKSVHTHVHALGPAYAEFDRLMKSREFLRWLGKVTGIPDLLYDPDYEGGGTHDNREGQWLDIHVDFNYHPRTYWHRRLNLILFLNDEWDADWGGVLELHRNPWGPAEQDQVRNVTPACNRCVVFETTESSWHGFDRIARPSNGDGRPLLSRRSLAVYFYTRRRPAAEIAPSHGTVYVPRPLPGSITTGKVLTEEDLHEIRVLLERRDQQIQYLYHRELEYSQALGFLRLRSARLMLRALWVVRKMLGRR